MLIRHEHLSDTFSRFIFIIISTVECYFGVLVSRICHIYHEATVA